MSNTTDIVSAAAEFPATFGLRAFPGKRFRVNLGNSYVSQGQVLLYTDIQTDTGWVPFAKGTPAELAREVTK